MLIMPEHIVAIHQPNFFPWTGYFDKIRRADTFILLDDVQFPKKGGSWTNRVSILNEGKKHWMSAAIDRSYSGVRNINAMQFADSMGWRTQALAQLKGAYCKAPFFAETIDIITPLMLHEAESIAAYNIHNIHNMCTLLNLTDTQVVLSSELNIAETATARLISLTKAVGGTVYMCGGGAEGYQLDGEFSAAGLALHYQHYTPKPYLQTGAQDFVAGLSITLYRAHTRDINDEREVCHCGNANMEAIPAGGGVVIFYLAWPQQKT
jgi:hypothetical protein